VPVFCSKCGKENSSKDKFCLECGEKLTIYRSKKSLAVGTVLENRYEIVTLIKSGGMGAVYKAIDTKFDSHCAVKELLFSHGTQEECDKSIEWFKREGKLLYKLDHANLPKVIDYFVSNERYYLVMNFIEGEDLENILKHNENSGLPEEKVLEWTKQVLHLLDYLHTQDPPIIYRDIKPGNIMIHKDGRAILIDFGIARAIQDDTPGQKTVVGTCGYSPPEQYQGNVEPRSDLYALGATIHHLLTGTPPIPFMLRPLRTINPSVSIEVEEFVVKATQNEMTERFSSAKEMLEAMNFKKQVKEEVKPAPEPVREEVKPVSSPVPLQEQPVFKPAMTVRMDIPTGASTVFSSSTTGLMSPCVKIMGGSFQMGSDMSDNEKPLHKVTVNNFYMTRYAVTNKEYCEFLSIAGNQTEEGFKWIDIKNDIYCGIISDGEKFAVKAGYENCPAVYVNWYGAVSYCNWKSEREGLSLCYGKKDRRSNNSPDFRNGNGYRLPTEAEWEYACCTGIHTNKYYWGTIFNSDYLWSFENSSASIHPVGQKKPNIFGLFDMSGNVWEWCNDFYMKNYYSDSPEKNPCGPDMGIHKVIRGGSWYDGSDLCRSSYRGHIEPHCHSNNTGFRMVRSAP
jgi:formylglycine-generating enzyme required for sulfatase activity/tRNA A-37 threonylcarbamoyl transferase component Bud32